MKLHSGYENMDNDDDNSDDDYLPESSDESNETSNEETAPINALTKSKSNLQEEQSSVQCLESTESIVVLTCQNTKGKRVWDKTNFCIFCINDGRQKTSHSKLARHIETVHRDEREIIQLSLLLPKPNENADTKALKQKERKLAFERLRKKGNFAHNTNVIEAGKGTLIVERRPVQSATYSYKDFLPCEYCFAFYYHVELFKHVANCHFAPREFVKYRRVKSMASMLIYQNSAACVDLKHLMSRMVVDDVSTALKKDILLIKYGNALCRRHWNTEGQNHHISNKLRELSKLLLAVKETCVDVKCFKDCLDCTKFQFVIEAVTSLCGWDEDSGCILTPSLGIKLGHSLKKMSKILKGEALMLNDHDLKQQADDFYTLVEMRWNDEISKCSRTELERRKWNKPQLLPFTDDMKVLHNHLKSISARSIQLLASDNGNTIAWRDLATATLSKLLLFNRRRAGEPAKLKVEEFTQKQKGCHQMNEEVKLSLSKFELQLCSSLKRVEIRGKRGRKVPLIITNEMESAMDLLIKLRTSSGVVEANPFLFAIPNGSLSNIRGPDALRKHVKICQLRNPQAFTSTNLRKHIATLSQVLNLKENELELLANHMGHDISIHREYYRLPESTLNLAKVGKILLAMEHGIGKFSGKKLDEIEVDLGEL